MLKTETPTPGLLFSSFLYRNDLFTEEELIKFWESHFGKSFSYVPKVNPLNAYYSQEMGPNLSRVFFLTTKAFSREFFLSTKLLSLTWEQTWAEHDKRRVNVDIGMLTLENFILATTKNYSHRVYIGQNIFADLTYYFHQGKMQTLPWTYPDYLDEEKIEFFSWGRSFLLQNHNA